MLEHHLVKRKIGKHLMLIDKKDPGISRTLRKYRWWRKWHREPEFMDIIQEEVHEGMVAFDLGGNIGYNTLILAELVGPDGHVYVVEPSPRNYQILIKNIELNNYTDRVTPFQIAISNRNGTSKFYLSESSNLHGLIPSSLSKEVIDVTVKTADDFFRDKHFPNFIRMDVEGAEVEVIQGMMETLRRAKPCVKILLEVHPMVYSTEHSLEDQLRKLINIGFHAKYVISAGVSRPDFFAERGYVPEKVYLSGGRSHGIYSKVSNEDMITTACHPHRQSVKLPFRSCLKRPWLFFDRTVYGDKIVRGLLLEK